MPDKEKLTLSAQVFATERGYEIMFMHAGVANGWTFDQAVLQESAALWNAIELFVDHEGGDHSARDLGGELSETRWSDEYAGLVALLTPTGPSKQVVIDAVEAMLAGRAKSLGFSADVLFEYDGRKIVQKIVQPYSLDLVYKPAFKTKVIRQLHQQEGEEEMSDTPVTPVLPVPPVHASAGEDHAEATREATRELMNAQAAIRAEVSAAAETRREVCANLLDSALMAAELPASAEKDVRGRFTETGEDGQPRVKLYRAPELRDVISNWKATLEELSSADNIVGPGRVSAVFSSEDQIQAAVYDLFETERDPGTEKLEVHRFSGIRELYLGMTGDYDFVGGFHRSRTLFQHTTASFPGLVKNALNKSLQKHWALMGTKGYDWWKKVVTVEHFNSPNDITWIIFGTVGSLPVVAEGDAYTELKIGDGAETSAFEKRGGYLGITLEAIMRDDTRKLRAGPKELANAGMRNISEIFAGFFTQASGAGPTLADGGALFNATVVTTAGGHANLSTAALGTDYTTWNAISLAMYNQPMLISNDAGYVGTGKKIALDPSICFVSRVLKSQAEALFMPRWASNVEAIAAAGGPSYGGKVDTVVVPEWTDANDFAAAQDKDLAPALMMGEVFGEMPQIFVAGGEQDAAMFTNDESRIKVRHWLACGVADYRPLHKSNVA